MVAEGRGAAERGADMDKPKGKLRLLENPAFLRYVEGLPTLGRRILLVPGGGAERDRYIVAVQTGENPPEIVKEAPEN